MFNQTGDICLANDNDVPYIYVALDDAGNNGRVSFDEGTSYSGCLSSYGTTFTSEYEIDQSVLVTADHCPEGLTFIKRNYEDHRTTAVEACTNAYYGIGDHKADANTIIYIYIYV